MTTDNPIHIGKEPIHIGKEPVTFETFAHQYELDALHALIHWLDGYERGSKEGEGRIPGYHELIMMYRKIKHGIEKTLVQKEIEEAGVKIEPDVLKIKAEGGLEF